MDKYERMILEIIEFHDDDIVTVSNPDGRTEDEEIDD